MQTNSLPTIAWTRLLGTKVITENTSITSGLDGSIYVSDSTNVSLDGQNLNGLWDVFITKYSQDGTKVWTRLLGGGSGDFSSALTVGLDGSIYVAGRTDWMIDGQTNNGRSDAFISKYNYDGTKVWTRLLGTTEVEYGVSLTTGNDGAIYLAGSSTGSLDGQSNNGFGTFDAFITKYNPDGTKVWTRMVGSRLDEYARAVTTGIDGSIYLCGSTNGSIDGQIHNIGETDAFITKYSPDGTKVWTRLLGGSGYANALAISSSADGSIYISGEGSGPLDGQGNSSAWNAFITKYDQDGTKVWTRRIGEGSRAKALTADLDGSVYVSGWTQGALDGQAFSGNADAFVSKYNPDGVKVWTRLFGTDTTEVSTSLTRGVDGSIYLAGSTTGSVDGRETITGVTDAFIIKLVDLDTTSPTIAISSNNTTLGVDVTSQIIFTLSESSENFTASDISVTGGTLSNFSGSGISYSALFTPNPNSTSNGVVYVESGVFADAAGNANVTPATFSISVITVTTDTSAPTVTNFSPSDEATGVAIGTKIAVTFNEAVQLGTGTIVLKTGAGLTVATFDTATSTNMSISGNTLTINPASNLNHNTYYKLEFPANTIKDIAGNSFAGTSSYNFTTVANTAPIATPAIEITKEDTESIGKLKGTDADGNTLTFAKVTDPNYGNVTINTSTGAYIYTPTANFNGTDSFTFKVNDGMFDSVVATVSLTISAVNDPPIAIAFSTTTNEDTAKTGRLTGTDVDRNLLKFAKVTDPNYGNVTVNTSTGAYTYTPIANFNGTDSFTFKVNDGTVDSAVATVSITINSVNDIPTGGVTISGTATQGQTLTVANSLADADGLGTISYQWKADGVNISGATSSTLKLTQAQVGKAISVVASYTDLANNAESVASNATSTVANLPEVISLGVFAGKTLNLVNPIQFENGKIYYLLDANGDGKNSYVSGNQSTYYLDAISHDFLDTLLNSGADTYDTQPNGAVYGVDDARTLKSGSIFLVLPTAEEFSKSFSYFDVFGQNIKFWRNGVQYSTNDSVPIFSGGQQFSTTIYPSIGWDVANRYWLATKSSTDKHYTGNTSGGYTDSTNINFVDSFGSNFALFQVLFNTAPVATFASASINEDTSKTGQLLGADVDGSALTFIKATDPSNGTVTINSTTGAYTYTPIANFNGTDSFTFKVNDGTVDSAVATVSITVAAVNDTPVAAAASATTNEDTAKTGTLAGTDVDGNTLTFAKVADPSNGTVTVNVNTGAYTYTPTANFNGTDSFTFKVNDGTVEWHPKLSHFEENLHPNLSHPNRLSCLIFEQGWVRSDQRGNFEQITQTCPSRQGLHPAS